MKPQGNFRQDSEPDAYLDRGLVCWAMGDQARAIGFYQTALRLQPESALGHYLLAYILKQAGRGVEARGEWARVLESRERGSRATWARRQARLELNQ